MLIGKVDAVESKQSENLRKRKIEDETSLRKRKHSKVLRDEHLEVNFIDSSSPDNEDDSTDNHFDSPANNLS